MDVHLSSHTEKLLNKELVRGRFRTPEEVIEHALELLHSEQEWKDSVHDKIEEGWAQLERGELLTPQQSRDDMEKRKSAWLANRPKP